MCESNYTRSIAAGRSDGDAVETSMIDHLSTYSTDFLATQKFYDAALGVLGYERNVDMVTEWDQEFPRGDSVRTVSGSSRPSGYAR